MIREEKKNSRLEYGWLLTCITMFVVVLFNGNCNAQYFNNEDVLRHFEKGEKLVPHVYDVDTNQWGYVFGHNVYFDYEWAEKYQIDGSGLVLGIIAHIRGSNKNEAKNALFSVYPVHKDMKPDRSIYTKAVTYKDVNIDGTESKIMFDSAVYVRDSFFVAFAVDDYAHDPQILGKDTMCLLGAEEGARDNEDLKVYGRNCIRTHSIVPDLAWIDAYDNDRKKVNTYLAIFPIMDFSSSAENAKISNGSVEFFKAGYDVMNHSINIGLYSSEKEVAVVRLIDLSGKEISHAQILLEQKQKLSFPLKLPPSFLGGNYVLVVSGKRFKLAQKIFIP